METLKQYHTFNEEMIGLQVEKLAAGRGQMLSEKHTKRQVNGHINYSFFFLFEIFLFLLIKSKTIKVREQGNALKMNKSRKQ